MSQFTKQEHQEHLERSREEIEKELAQQQEQIKQSREMEQAEQEKKQQAEMEREQKAQEAQRQQEQQTQQAEEKMKLEQKQQEYQQKQEEISSKLQERQQQEEAQRMQERKEQRAERLAAKCQEEEHKKEAMYQILQETPQAQQGQEQARQEQQQAQEQEKIQQERQQQERQQQEGEQEAQKSTEKQPILSFRNIALALDESPQSHAALLWTLENILKPKTDILQVVSVGPHDSYMAELASMTKSMLDLGDKGQTEAPPVAEPGESKEMVETRAILKKAQDMIENYCTEKKEKISFMLFPIKGASPKDNIVNFCKDHQTDMVVLASQGKSALKRMVMGSVCEYVVQHAPCTVIVVRQLEGKQVV